MLSCLHPTGSIFGRSVNQFRWMAASVDNNRFDSVVWELSSESCGILGGHIRKNATHKILVLLQSLYLLKLCSESQIVDLLCTDAVVTVMF